MLKITIYENKLHIEKTYIGRLHLKMMYQIFSCFRSMNSFLSVTSNIQQFFVFSTLKTVTAYT